jgi:hypothetical protein
MNQALFRAKYIRTVQNYCKMENEKIERIKNPKLSAGRIPDLLKASIMESQKKLTLVQKKDVITLHLQFKDLGYKKLSQLVAKKLGFPISKSAVRDIIKKKNDILETTTSEKTTRTHCPNESMNRFRAAVVDVMIAESHHITVTNSIIKTYCLDIRKRDEFLQDSSIQKLTFSVNWIVNLKKDFKISWRKITGKKYLVNQGEVESARLKIRSLMQLYDPTDCYNMDETRFQFHSCHQYGNYMANFDTAFTHRWDERDAYSAGSFINLAGETVYPFFISKNFPRGLFDKNERPKKIEYVDRNGNSKSEQLKMFSIQDKTNEGVINQECIFAKSARGYMTRPLFIEIMKIFNERQKKKGTKALVLLDNCPSHVKVAELFDFTHIHFHFLPSNSTSVLQPCSGL